MLGEDVLQLIVIFTSERKVVSFFDGDSAFFCFANAAAAGAIHIIEQLLLRLGKIGAIGRIELTIKADEA